MSIDLFDSRHMTEALEELYTPSTHLRDKIFTGLDVSSTRYIDIDHIHGDQGVAVYVSPEHEGQTVEHDQYVAKSFRTPYTKERMITTATNFLERKAGKHIYNSKTTAGKRARQALGKDLKHLSMRLDRLEEYQCSTALQTGIITVKGEGISASIDFGMPASHLITLSGTALWSDLTNSVPDTNLKTWFDLIIDDSDLIPQDVYFGKNVVPYFLRNTKLLSLLDNRRVDLGEIKPSELKKNKVRYIGHLRNPGVDIYQYQGKYYDKFSQTNKPFIDDDSVVMYGEGLRAVKHYGAIEDVENFGFNKRFAKSWLQKDPSGQVVLLQSAPMMALHQVNGVVVAKVL